MDFFDLWEAMDFRLQTKDLEKASVRILFKRNKFVFEQKFTNPRTFFHAAKQELGS